MFLRVLLYIYLFTSGNLTEFGDEYFEAREYGDIEVVEKRRRNLERYKSVFNSKSDDDALVCARSQLRTLLDSLVYHHFWTSGFCIWWWYINSVLILIYCLHCIWANFAKWELPHGKFGFRHPWKQYLVVAALVRQCAHRIDALNSYINSNFQVLFFSTTLLEICIYNNEIKIIKLFVK